MSRDYFGAVVVTIMVIGLIVSGIVFANFYSNCKDNGGSIGIFFSGEGGFKCTDSEGHLIDVF